MTYAEEHLARVKALPDDYPNKADIVSHWKIERSHEILLDFLIKEKKEYEEMGLEHPFLS